MSRPVALLATQEASENRDLPLDGLYFREETWILTRDLKSGKVRKMERVL